MTEHVIVVDEGPIRLVRMNRLEKKNAITDDMYDKLAAALEGASHSKAIHCVVITGGRDVFSAGSDSAMAARSAAGMSLALDRAALRRLACHVAGSPRPASSASTVIALSISACCAPIDAAAAPRSSSQRVPSRALRTGSRRSTRSASRVTGQPT